MTWTMRGAGAFDSASCWPENRCTSSAICCLNCLSSDLLKSLDTRGRRPVTHSFFSTAKFTRGVSNIRAKPTAIASVWGGGGVKSLERQKSRPVWESRVHARGFGNTFSALLLAWPLFGDIIEV